MDSPEPTAPNAPIPEDELVTAYLHGRDVPCPKCGYNRRDGKGATCPECDEQLRIIPTGKAGATQHTAFLKAMLVLFIVIILFHLVSNAHGFTAFAQRINVSKIGWNWFTLITIWLMINVVGWTIALLLCALRLRMIQKNQPMTLRGFIVPIALIFCLLYGVTVLYEFFSF